MANGEKVKSCNDPDLDGTASNVKFLLGILLYYVIFKLTFMIMRQQTHRGRPALWTNRQNGRVLYSCDDKTRISITHRKAVICPLKGPIPP